MHRLILDVADGKLDLQTLRVHDLSQYSPNLVVANPIMEVLPAFDDIYHLIPFTPGQYKAIVSTDLGIAAPLQDLPDGVYRIRYSVSPNDKRCLEVVHYRVANLLQRVYGNMAQVALACDTGIDDCGNVELHKNQNVLLHLYSSIMGVQSLCRDSYLIPKAEELYRQAARQYDRLFPVGCKTC